MVASIVTICIPIVPCRRVVMAAEVPDAFIFFFFLSLAQGNVKDLETALIKKDKKKEKNDKTDK